jgi:hypothetical protein
MLEGPVVAHYGKVVEKWRHVQRGGSMLVSRRLEHVDERVEAGTSGF